MSIISVKTKFETDGVSVGFNQHEGRESFIVNSYFSLITLIKEHQEFFLPTILKISDAFGYAEPELEITNLLAKSVVNRLIYLGQDDSIPVESFMMPIPTDVEITVSNIIIDGENISTLDNSKFDAVVKNIGNEDASDAIFSVIFNSFSMLVTEKLSQKLSNALIDDKKELNDKLVIDTLNSVLQDLNTYITFDEYDFSNFLYFSLLNLFSLSYADFNLTDNEIEVVEQLGAE